MTMRPKKDSTSSSTRSLFREPIKSGKTCYELLFTPCNSRFSMKIFESRTAMKEEQSRQMLLDYFVIHPCSLFKFIWNIIIVVTLLLNLIVIPIELAFFYQGHTAFWIGFNSSSSVVFALDIIVNFLSGIVIRDRIRLDRGFVGKRYLRTWFLIDLLGTIPFDLLLSSCNVGRDEAVSPGSCAVVRILGCFKLLRITSMGKQIGEWQSLYMKSTHRLYLKIVNVILSILLMCHFNGCLLFFVSMIQGFPETSWVVTTEIQSSPWYEQYIWSLFSAWSIMVAISFVKAEVQTMDEVLTCFFVLASGAIGYGVLLANGTALVQTLDYSRNAHEQTMSEVRQFIQYKRLPRALSHRICDYFENRYKGLYFDEDKIMAEMSDVLRDKLLQFECKSLIRSVTFLRDADPCFVADIVKRLRNEFFQPGDKILSVGTLGSKMYFLETGNVDVVLANGCQVATLRDGAYFGEMCLLLRESRSASVIARSYCTLYSLSRDDFEEVLQTYPNVREDIEKEVLSRQHVNESHSRNNSVVSFEDPVMVHL